MANVANFSGIDISKRSFDVCVFRAGREQVRKFAYTEEGAESLLGFLPEKTTCVMESTGTYHIRLACFLVSRGVRVCVVNPLSVRRYSQSLMRRTKTDRSDSRLLRSYGEMYNPAEWVPRKSSYVELQQLLRYQELLIRTETSLRNQLEAFGHSSAQSDFAIGKIRADLERNQKDQKETEAQMLEIVRKNDGEFYDRVTSIPGIGRKTAIVLVALTAGLENFDSAKKLCSYFGLNPRVYESGTSVRGRASICKMGLGTARKLLYLCALSASRCNPPCRRMYERLLQQGKPKKLCLVAVANKLLRQVFSIVKNNTDFDPHFLPISLAS